VSRLRYLKGIDWVIHGLDRSIRQTSGLGNWSQIVFELDGQLDFESFRSVAQDYVSSFPVLHGRTVRGWQLAPAWRIPRGIKDVKLSVETHRLPDNAPFEAVVEKLGQCVMALPGTPGHYIAFNILYSGEKSYLAFRFDHRLFDARGAELFIRGLMEMQRPEYKMEPQKAHLRPWIEKFKSGQKILRMLRSQQDIATPFQLQPNGSSTTLRFSVISLNQDESEILTNRAYKEAGYLMLTPWLAARIATQLDALGCPLGGQLIPCAIDQRKDKNSELFFNHVAFIYLARASGEGAECPKRFSRQFYEQIQQGLPQHFENAWKLARIIPLALYGKLLHGALKKFAGTFNVANVGDGLSSIQSIAGLTINNAFHMPMIPPATGFGFFINTFQGRLNLCLTSASRILSDDEHSELTQLLKRDLLSPS